MNDIKTSTDIELLIKEFYNEVEKDSVIGYIFTDIAKLDWEKHLPVMYGFWESILFGTGDYKGNPMVKHIALNKKVELLPEHFERWKLIWENTIRKNFNGPKSTEAVQRAHSIAGLMLLKVQQSGMK